MASEEVKDIRVCRRYTGNSKVLAGAGVMMVLMLGNME